MYLLLKKDRWKYKIENNLHLPLSISLSPINSVKLGNGRSSRAKNLEQRLPVNISRIVKFGLAVVRFPPLSDRQSSRYGSSSSSVAFMRHPPSPRRFTYACRNQRQLVPKFCCLRRRRPQIFRRDKVEVLSEGESW